MPWPVHTQMQLIFEALLEALTLQHAALSASAAATPGGPAACGSSAVLSDMGPLAEGGAAFLEGVARQLLGVDLIRKGRCVCRCARMFVCRAGVARAGAQVRYVCVCARVFVRLNMPPYARAPVPVDVYVRMSM